MAPQESLGLGFISVSVGQTPLDYMLDSEKHGLRRIEGYAVRVVRLSFLWLQLLILHF